MMRLPESKRAARSVDEDRIGKAYAALNGGDAQGPERQEDAAYAEFQGLLGQTEQLLVKLRQLHSAPGVEKQSHLETGAGAPPEEQSEQADYTEISSCLKQMEEIIAKLQELHQAPREDESVGMPDTGSPSVQGQP